jgi:hypothetical protein
MLLAEQLAAAITSAPSFDAIDNLARLTWRGLAEGYIADSDADALGTALEARRTAFRDRGPRLPPSASRRPGGPSAPARRPPRSPDNQRSLERRRRQATSGILPAQLACRFTLGQVAVLAVVGRQTKATGSCVLPIDAIAAMAGVSRTLVKGALREAVRLGLVRVDERPRPGRRHDTNVVTITSAEWRTWLKLGSSRDRGQKSDYHGVRSKKSLVEGCGPNWRSGYVPVYNWQGKQRREEHIANGTGEQHD